MSESSERSVIRGDGGRIVCDRCQIADGAVTRARGLLGRGGLDRGEGILLQPTFSIHTFFMRFAIDVVFLDDDHRVLRVDANVRPWRLKACRGARSVLELAAGAARGLSVGDRIELRDAV